MKTTIKKTLLLITLIVTLFAIVPQSTTKADRWKPCGGTWQQQGGDGGGSLEIYCWSCQTADICGLSSTGVMCCWDSMSD
jgi:hypothetical protein